MISDRTADDILCYSNSEEILQQRSRIVTSTYACVGACIYGRDLQLIELIWFKWKLRLSMSTLIFACDSLFNDRS